MDVQLTPGQEAFIRQAIESGRLQREEDAVKEALSLWEDRERRRIEILAAVDKVEASLARGEGRRLKTREEANKLADDVRRRGMARLAAEPGPSEERIATTTPYNVFALAPMNETPFGKIRRA